MASNFFGEVFRITTFGESHGPVVGVVLDGCPSEVTIDQQFIEDELAKRRPGNSSFTSQRQETDSVQILSGVFEGKTTGAPIALLIDNQDVQSRPYTKVQSLLRPGHAQFTYQEKYGVFDHRGGGRASARETVARVAAGAVAKQFLKIHHIHCRAYLTEIGGLTNEASWKDLLISLQQEGDSVGGIIECTAYVPIGLGDPVYGKIEAKLASAMMSLPATKGFEIGEGFQASRMKGSEHNDPFETSQGKIQPKTNLAGGTLGGISTGCPLVFRVAFKPTSSIRKPIATVTTSGEPAIFQWSDTSRHDPCVAIRAVSVVEAMTALVLADCVLLNRCSRAFNNSPSESSSIPGKTESFL